MSKQYFGSFIVLLAIASSCYSQNHEYKIAKVYHIASPGDGIT
jgi:hypothetical protein